MLREDHAQRYVRYNDGICRSTLQQQQQWQQTAVALEQQAGSAHVCGLLFSSWHHALVGMSNIF
jgi:hypothetical protein